MPVSTILRHYACWHGYQPTSDSTLLIIWTCVDFFIREIQLIINYVVSINVKYYFRSNTPNLITLKCASFLTSPSCLLKPSLRALLPQVQVNINYSIDTVILLLPLFFE